MKRFHFLVHSWKHIPYTWKHYKAFRMVEKQLLGKHVYWFHDWDKLIMYIFLPFLGTKRIKEIHRRISKHHINDSKHYNDCDFTEAIIDWECARYTKPDKPETAFEYVMHKKGSTHYIRLLLELEQLNLIDSQQFWDIVFEDIPD